ncbi:hypothetical protein ACR6C2_04620 [Streptomyces sp. INA 01156]
MTLVLLYVHPNSDTRPGEHGHTVAARLAPSADLLRAAFTRHTVTVGKSLCISGTHWRAPPPRPSSRAMSGRLPEPVWRPVLSDRAPARDGVQGGPARGCPRREATSWPAALSASTW